MLKSNAEFKGRQSPIHSQQTARRQLTARKQIDQLVYELYGLTEAEIRLVEEATT